MPKLAALAAPFALLLTSGCTVTDVVTLPVKVAKTGVNAAGSAVDAVTTSQAEADQKRGREIRKREEKLGKLERAYGKQSGRCAEGDDEACAKAERTRAELDALLPTVPYERD